MRRFSLPSCCLAALSGLLACVIVTQSQGQPKRFQRPRAPASEAKKAESRLPDDPRLLKIHKDFVLKAEKLAVEYEQKKEYDKARTVCKEILKLVPRYPGAQAMLSKIANIEATAETFEMDVLADKDWQDTKVNVLADKPITILAKGSWKFNMSHDLSADGMEIPKELRDFKLGSLIGIIETGDLKDMKPFLIGSRFRLVPEKSGRLYVRMHDSNPKDNTGKVTIQMQGTFVRGSGR
ncbi:MAG: hypothetical protein N2C14_18970 [Planctomycetales bacterium]